MRLFHSVLFRVAAVLAGCVGGGAVRADEGVVAGVRFSLENVQPEPGGGQSAEVRVFFPAGFGVTKSISSRRQLASFPCGRVAVDDALIPVGSLPLEPSAVGAATLYAAHERLPLLFQTTQVVWNTEDGTFRIRRDTTYHVRQLQADVLAALAPQLVEPGAAARPANDGWLLHPASGEAEDVLISTDADGRAVLASARIDLPAGAFEPHFPSGSLLAWTETGSLVVADGDVVAASSILPGASEVVLSWSPVCPPSTAAPDESTTFVPGGGQWRVTPDGGVRAEGTLPAAPLRWGARDAATFAQTTSAFTQASMLAAGHVLRGSEVPAAADYGAGTLLLTGHGAPGDPTVVERPTSAAAYAAGLADYPGLNIRADAGAATATTLIGDTVLGPYPMLPESKFYIRRAGVSGLLRADQAAFAALAGGVWVHGFSLRFDGLQLSYLDNRNRDSALSGAVRVPGVRGQAGFEQDFRGLRLTCSGEPGELTLPPGSEHTLHYWRASFEAMSAEFRVKSPAPLAPEPRAALVFGARVSLPQIVREPLAGGLGFLPTGALVRAADNFPGVTSRLRKPSRLTLHGTRSAVAAEAAGFTVQPVSDLYFNDSGTPGAPVPGFVSFAGKVDVPFFQDLEVHVMARATGGPTLVRAGWKEGAGAGERSFFNDTGFDPTHRGYPVLPGNAPDTYANDPAYHVHGRQNWLGFVNFDFPLTWDATRRHFKSAGAQLESPFLVLETQRVVEKLTPSGADLRFGLQFQGLPRLSLASLLIDEDEAINELVGKLPGGPRLAGAARALEDLLNGRSDTLVDSAADAAVDAWLDALFAPGGPLDGVLSAEGAAIALGGTDALLNAELSGMIGTLNEVHSVVGEIRAALEKVAAGMEAADELLAKDASGKRASLVVSTVAIGGQPGAQIAQQIDHLINIELKGTLDTLHAVVKSQRGAVADALRVLDTLTDVLQVALNAANGATGIAHKAVESVRTHFSDTRDETGRFLAELGESRIRDDIKRLVRDEIHASGFVADLQATLRDLMEPIRDDAHLALERLHGVINDVLRTAFSEVENTLLAELSEPAANANRAIGAFNDTLELSRAEGTARIEGDTLVSAFINTRLGLRVPDKVSLQGWLRFSNYKAGQLAPGCAGAVPADGRLEIEAGAEGEASLQGNRVAAKLKGRYAMTRDGAPLAIGGTLDVQAPLQFDALSLRAAKFEFGVGDVDNFLYAEGDGSLWFLDAKVKAFLGRTCDQALLQNVDPQLAQVLPLFGIAGALTPAQPATGIYWNADGGIVLNRLVGLPDKPLKLMGKGGTGYFMFLDKPLLNFGALGSLSETTRPRLVVGMTSLYGLTVQAGPVEASAEMRIHGGLDPLSLFFAPGDTFPQMWSTLVERGGLLTGAVTGDFTARAAPLSKTFHFTARGGWTPVPPPGFLFVNRLDF